MTTAADSEQQTPTDAALPALSAVPGGLSLLPGLDADDTGLCIGGVCRLPGAKD